MLLRLAVIALALAAARAEDPGISGVQRISKTGGTFSWARFGPNSRFVFAAARGDPYGKCDHIYRFDRVDGQQPVSLVSTGIGWERQLAAYTDADNAVEFSLETTAAAEWAKANKGAAISEAAFCSDSKCTAPITNADVKTACESLHYIERREGALAVSQLADHTVHSSPLNLPKWQSPRAGTAKLSIWSQKPQTGNIGEQLILKTEAGERTLTSAANWADGFVVDDADPAAVRILYSGAQAAGSALNALNEGVIPYRGAKLFALSDLNAAAPREQVVAEDTTNPAKYSYLWPSVSKALPGVVFATRVDHTTNKAVIVKIEGTKPHEVLTDEELNSHHGQVSADGKFLVFVGDRDNLDSQLYVASLGKTITKPIFTTKTPKAYNMYSDQATGLQLYDDLAAQYSHFSLSADQKTLLYQAVSKGPCREVYQLQLDKGESIVRKRLSSSLHDANSPNFFPGTTDILMASTILRQIPNVKDGISRFSCVADTCDLPTDAAMKKVCDENLSATKTHRLVSPDAELVVVNELGLLQRRLTTDTVWQGEVKVSPDGKFFVYAQRNGNNFELRRQNIDGTGDEALDLGLEAGVLSFFFDLSFSSDSRRLTYAVYRPHNDAMAAKFAALLNYHIMDIPVADIQVYDFEKKKEIIGLLCRDRNYVCRSPQFVPGDDNRLIMLITNGGTGSTIPVAYSLVGQRKQVAADFRVSANGAIHLYKQNSRTKILISDQSKFLHGNFLIDKPPKPPGPGGPDATTEKSAAFRTEFGLLAVLAILGRAVW